MKSHMHTGLLMSILAIGCVTGCKEDPPASLYDPNYQDRPAPVITSVAPSPLGLAGVSTVTITGSNFSPDRTQNQVMFDATPAAILTATATQLTVRAPLLIKDSIQIKISVMGATLFSNIMYYKLDPAVINFGGWTGANETYGVAIGPDDSLYASTLSGGVGVGVMRYRGNGNRAFYSEPYSSTVNNWPSMKFGPGGILYAVGGSAGRNNVFQTAAGGGAGVLPTRWLTVAGATRLLDIDFDSFNNLWAVGTANLSIYRIRTSDANVKAFPCRGDMRAVRVYAGFVYVGGKRDSLEKIFRFPIISADSLGAEEEYFNLSAVYGVDRGGVQALTFNSDGDAYIGTDNAEGVRLVHPDKSSEAFYAGLMLPKSISFAWGTGPYLYISRTGGQLPGGPGVANALLRVNTEKASAPTYGR